MDNLDRAVSYLNRWGLMEHIHDSEVVYDLMAEFHEAKQEEAAGHQGPSPDVE